MLTCFQIQCCTATSHGTESITVLKSRAIFACERWFRKKTARRFISFKIRFRKRRATLIFYRVCSTGCVLHFNYYFGVIRVAKINLPWLSNLVPPPEFHRGFLDRFRWHFLFGSRGTKKFLGQVKFRGGGLNLTTTVNYKKTRKREF